MIEFNVTGSLDVATDPSDLPDDWFVRCKNLSTIQKGIAKTRDGSAKINASAINTSIWWIEEQGGDRYTFAGTIIYKNESSIATGLTSAQWSAVKYNAFNDSTQQIFALNGTDRKRIEGDTCYEWGIEAPTVAPTLSVGQGSGLTGAYSAYYTYVRKVNDVTVAESNPSPSSSYVELTNQSLVVDVTTPSDAQVTHIRLYRTQANGNQFYRDQDILTENYAYGICFTWEETDVYIAGNAWKFTVTDATHGTENTYSWEEDPSVESEDIPTYGGEPWFAETEDLYFGYATTVLVNGGYPLSYSAWLAANGYT